MDIVLTNIEDINRSKINHDITIKGVLVDKKPGIKKDKTPYITISVQDVTGTIEFPVWDESTASFESLVSGIVVMITGNVNYYDEQPQLRYPNIRILQNEDPKKFIPTYEIPDSLFEYFDNTIKYLDEREWKFVNKALGLLDKQNGIWNKFITAPAASKHHQNKRGGLFLHTIGVMKAIESMIENYVNNPFFLDASKVINKSRLMLKAILHDIEKINEYEYEICIKRKKTERDHIIRGVAYVEKINEQLGNIYSEAELEDICYSIQSHHGHYGRWEPKSIEDIMLHLADMIDSKIAGAVENKQI